MKKIDKFLDHVEETILVISLSIMLAITFGNVLSRKLLHFSWAFAEELTVILFIFSSLIGAAIAAKKGGLIGLTLLFDICPPKFRKIFHAVLLVTSAFFTYIMVYYGIDMVISEYKSQMTTPALGLPEWIFGLAIPVGCAFLGFRLMQFSVKEILKKGDAT